MNAEEVQKHNEQTTTVIETSETHEEKAEDTKPVEASDDAKDLSKTDKDAKDQPKEVDEEEERIAHAEKLLCKYHHSSLYSSLTSDPMYSRTSAIS